MSHSTHYIGHLWPNLPS